MRASTSASQACGSTSFILAVTIRLYITAARPPPRLEPQNSQDYRPRAMPHGSFGGVIRQADAAVVEEAGERAPAREHLVHCLGDVVAT
jgi:hypothetical protein